MRAPRRGSTTGQTKFKRSVPMWAARVLVPGGRLCFSIVHPINSAGEMHRPAGAPYEIRGSYLEESRYRYDMDREGIALSFHSMHRPLEAYAKALESAGFLIESLREPRLTGPMTGN